MNAILWDIFTWLQGLDVRIYQALIAGAVVALGWMVNGHRNRKEARDRREERLRDLHRALYAEIVVHVLNMGSVEQIEAAKQAQVAKMLKTASFKPFLPRQKRDQVFQSFLPEIHILPRTSIDPVVAFYSVIGLISRLEEDMGGERFAKLPKTARAAIYSDYMDLLNQSVTLGQFSLQVIETYSRKGEAAAKSLVDETRSNIRLGGSPDDQ